jgi:transposase InsO family protein
VISLRKQSLNCWGGRKLSRRLRARNGPKLAPSTITKILHRHGLIEPERSAATTPWQRFERSVPNELWQMDFKGHFALVAGGRCHSLTGLDDPFRFALVLEACADEHAATVQTALTAAFRRCGLPRTMLMEMARRGATARSIAGRR